MPVFDGACFAGRRFSSHLVFQSFLNCQTLSKIPTAIFEPKAKAYLRWVSENK
jgi:hypothetical protein